MACSKCAERRRKLKAMLAEKKAKRKGIQAAAIGAVLSVTEAAGKVLGIGENSNDGPESDPSSSQGDSG